MLPTKNDFNPWGKDAWDAETAWHNFGGLTLAEANIKFRERPDIYQEDFMFMGGKAFAFYFSIIEDYLRESPQIEGDGDDREAWILAKGIQNQFDADTARHVTTLTDRVIALSRFVQDNISYFGYCDGGRIALAWKELEANLRSERNYGGAD